MKDKMRDSSEEVWDDRYRPNPNRVAKWCVDASIYGDSKGHRRGAGGDSGHNAAVLG